MPNKIFSFGYRHGLKIGGTEAFKPTTNRMVPTIQEHLGCLVVDVRGILPKNPYHNKKLRALRGDDKEVIKELESTHGIHVAYHKLRNDIEKWLKKSNGGDILIGCTGGHHRSVYIAERLSKDLNLPVTHLNYHDK